MFDRIVENPWCLTPLVLYLVMIVLIGRELGR